MDASWLPGSGDALCRGCGLRNDDDELLLEVSDDRRRRGFVAGRDGEQRADCHQRMMENDFHEAMTFLG